MSISSNIQYPHDSIEVIPVEVSAGGARITTGVQIGLLPTGTSRAGITWTEPVTAGNRFGYWNDGTLDPGVYEVWAKVDAANDEVPLIPCGIITLY